MNDNYLLLLFVIIIGVALFHYVKEGYKEKDRLRKFNNESLEKFASEIEHYRDIFLESGLPQIETDIRLGQKEVLHSILKETEWYEQKPTGEMKPFEVGDLYITNNRIIFRGKTGNKQILINKILNIIQSTDGMEIEKETGKKLLIAHSFTPKEFTIIEHLLKKN